MMREGVRCERKRSGISLQKRLEVMPSDVLEATTYSLSTSQGSYNARAFIGMLSVHCALQDYHRRKKCIYATSKPISKLTITITMRLGVRPAESARSANFNSGSSARRSFHVVVNVCKVAARHK